MKEPIAVAPPREEASGDEPRARLLITLCTYNERENVEELIPEIRRIVPQADVLVIDDNSPDGTSDLVARLGRDDPQILLISRVGQRGLGSAMIAGFQYAVDRKYEYVIHLDADFSHPPRYLPDLLEAIDKADVVIGSRYAPGGKVIGWTWRRKLMSRAINTYARIMLGLKTRDNSGSYRCYRVSRLEQIDLSRCRAQGYAILEELLFRCRQAGCRFVEVPITFEERRHGSSKINWREAVAAVWLLFRLRLAALVTQLRTSAP